MNQGNPSSSSSGKLKFTPKPSRRKQPNRPLQPASGGADEDADSELLLKRFQEKLQGRRRKTENNPPVRVAFGPGAVVAASSGTEIVVSDEKNPESGRSNLDRKEQNISLSSAGKTVEIGSCDEDMKDAFNGSSSEDEVYKEPWDYERNYPTVLPLREPYSGDPVILDEAEFGEAAGNAEYNEKNINAAGELGLLETGERKRLLFFQFPRFLPSVKGSVSSMSKGKEAIGHTAAPSRKLCGLGDLPAGHMGKLVVFKSGAVKLKLGEVLYDVSPGSAGKANEDLVAVNIKTKKCSRIGQVEKHAVVSLDVDSILDKSNDG